MADGHSFSGLKDPMNLPSSPNTRFLVRSRSSTSLEVQTNLSQLNDETFLGDYFRGLSIQKSLSSSINSLDFMPLSPFSSFESPIDLSPRSTKSKSEGEDEEEEHIDGKAELSYVKNDTSAYSGRSPGKAEKLYPPPICCLKQSKTTGKRFFYHRYDVGDGGFVQEEIRIPTRDTFCAARDNGRLKLYSDYADDDSDEVEEEDDDEEDEIEWVEIGKA